MEQLYVRNGRTFEKANPNRMLDCLSEGHWLVTVHKNNTSVKLLIVPDYASVYAAMQEAEDAMCKAALEKATMKPPSMLMSKKESHAWEEAWGVFRKIMGKDMPRTFNMSSIHDIIQAGLEELKKHIVNKSTKVGKKSTYCVKGGL